jgi:hypothetical protein
MREHSRLPDAARTGSTARHRDALAAWRTRRAAELAHSLRMLDASFARRWDTLLTPSVDATVRAITDKALRAWAASLPSTAGQVEKMTQVKRNLHNEADDALRREVPGYASINALQQEYSVAFRELVDQHSRDHAELAIQGPGWVDANVDSFGLRTFEPPFEVFDLFTVDVDNHIDSDLSCVVPSVGLVVNDIGYRHENTWGDIGRYNPFAFSDASVGVDFTAPRSGLLNIAVSMHNLYANVHMSGGNNWGFSSATLRADVRTIILALRDDTRFYTFGTSIEQEWVDPGGVSFSYTFPEFSPGPAIFVASVDEPLDAGDQVQILAGCQTWVYSEVKNMNCRVNATQWWQVDKLWVWLE